MDLGQKKCDLNNHLDTSNPDPDRQERMIQENRVTSPCPTDAEPAISIASL